MGLEILISSCGIVLVVSEGISVWIETLEAGFAIIVLVVGLRREERTTSAAMLNSRVASTVEARSRDLGPSISSANQ
jgi:hypothetical protein